MIVDTSVHNPLMTTMVSNTSSTWGAPFQSPSLSLNHGQSQVNNRGFQSYNGNKNRGRGRLTQGSRFYSSVPTFSPLPHVFPNSNPRVLGSSSGNQFWTPASMLLICQFATLRNTLPHFMEIRLLSIPLVIFMEEIIIPFGIAFIMIRVLTTLGCTPMLLILHSFLIICHHRTCSIVHLQLLLRMY